MLTALETLALLREGNRRFLAEDPHRHTLNSRKHCSALAADQEPVAIILSCSDSRVAPEILFDQGLGDLFVIRVAGNIAEPTQIGSIEYAAEFFGTRLIVVLGHSGCGAVIGTLEVLAGRMEIPSPHLGAIIDRIGTVVQPLLESDPDASPEDQLRISIRANVSAAASQLRNESPVLARLIKESGFLVVGAEYSLETGEVDFFDGAPE